MVEMEIMEEDVRFTLPMELHTISNAMSNSISGGA